MITGLAALNKSNRPDTGDDIRVGPGWRNVGTGNGNGNGGGKQPNTLPPFMPGQQNALAQQLNQGFGGGNGQWNNYMDMIYGPLKVKPFQPGRGGGGDGSNDDKQNQPDGEYTMVYGKTAALQQRPRERTGNLRPGQPVVSPNAELTNPNVSSVAGQYFPGDYISGLAALRGRT